jgi:hypothetical protein
MDSALDVTVESARPIPFALASGKARQEAANRRADDCRRTLDLREEDLSRRPLGEQAAHDWIRAGDERVCRFKGWATEGKQDRAEPKQPQFENAVPFSRPDQTKSDSLDRAPVGETQALRSGLGKLDNGLEKRDALLGFDSSVTRLTLPRLPAIHMVDGSDWRIYRGTVDAPELREAPRCS